MDPKGEQAIGKLLASNGQAVVKSKPKNGEFATKNVAENLPDKHLVGNERLNLSH